MLNPDLAMQSAGHYSAVRKTIGCFIATYAIAHGYELLHADGDFDPFEAHLGLRVLHPPLRA